MKAGDSRLGCNRTLGGRGPVSQRVSGPTTRPRRLTLTKAPKACPLYMTPDVAVEGPEVVVVEEAVVSPAGAWALPARSGGPPPGLLDGGAGQAGEPQAAPKISSRQGSANCIL